MYFIIPLLVTLILAFTVYAQDNYSRDSNNNGCCYNNNGYNGDCFYAEHYSFEDDAYSKPCGQRALKPKKSAGCGCKRRISEYFNAYTGTGYRQDEMFFKISQTPATVVSPSPDPFDDDIITITNTTRKMEWHKLQILPFYLYADYRDPCGLVLKLYGDYGRIYCGDGSNQHYLNNSTNDLIFFDKGNANRGQVWDMGGGIGYNIRLYGDYWMITPLIGYDHNALYYRLYDLTETFGPRVGDISGHHSYQSLWRGPWIGFETKSGPWCGDAWWFRAGYDWHYMVFDATLTDSLPDVERCKRKQTCAHGQGNHVWAGLDYHCCREWSGGIFVSWKDYHAGSGTQTSKCDGSSTKTKVKLTDVNWQSFNLLLTIGYHY